MNIFRVSAVVVTFLMSFFAHSADNLLLVTLDGLRWQEMFRGYDPTIVNEIEKESQRQRIAQAFSGESAQVKRQRLMPFIWDTVAKQGTIIGNRDNNSDMSLANTWWFSYPGYNEMLTGKADPKVDSNKTTPNENVSFLEWLNQQEGYKNKVAAFGSWDVFPSILNTKRSNLMVNAGFMPASWPNLSEHAQWLNALQTHIPSPWHNVRLDAFTAGFAKDYITSQQPKVVYVALGETDDFAHDGDYYNYVFAAKRDDELVAELWQHMQTMPQYKNNTNLIITVDHGRGQTLDTWQHHASPAAVKGYLKSLKNFPNGIEGADQIWLAAMGPDIANHGEISDSRGHKLDQVAATALIALGIEPDLFSSDIGVGIKVLELGSKHDK